MAAKDGNVSRKSPAKASHGDDALRENEEGLRLAVEATGIGIWDVDALTGARRWSDEFKAIVGLPVDSPADQEVFSSLIHPDDRDWVNQRYRDAYDPAGDGRYDAEFRIRRFNDGAERWVMIKGQVSFDAERLPVRGVGTILEITDGKSTAEALAASEERYRLAVTAFHGATYETDLETGYAYRAPRAYEMLGVDPTRGEPTREWWFERIHPEDAPRFHAALDALFAGQTAELDLEFRVRHENGSWVWVWQRGLAVRGADGKLKRTVGAILDITGRKQAEAALRESEARFRHMADSAPALIWMTDAAGRITFANMHYDYLFGRPAASMLGEGWREVVHPDDVERFFSEFREAFLVRRPFRSEVRVRDKDGQIRWLRCEGVARLDDSGVFLGYTGCNVDITDAKLAQHRQQLLINELNHRVKNTLASVQYIAAQTLGNAPTTQQARAAFEARLMALSRTHDVLTRENWEGAGIKAIVAQTIEPYRGLGESRFQVEGPEVKLPPRMALALAMALGELATNAVKYGALSNSTGCVRLVWGLEGSATDPRLKLRWEERGGPAVEAPSQRGFGTRLIERGLAQDIDGEVRISFQPTGVVCALDAPVKQAA